MICSTSFKRDLAALLVFANGIDNPFKCEPENCHFFFQKRFRSTFIPFKNKTKKLKICLALCVLQNNFVTNFMTLTL